MDSWGSKLLAAVTAVAQMAALGFGLPADAFSRLMQGGPHLLAPTGSDLLKHGAVGTVLAGFHYDLNFITVRGGGRDVEGGRAGKSRGGGGGGERGSIRSDLVRHGAVGTVLAGFHYDLNFITVRVLGRGG